MSANPIYLQFVENPTHKVPAQPVEREKPPTGAEWVHEIKHDSYRMIVHKDGENVRLCSRKAIDWSRRLPAIARSASNRASISDDA
jgi:ATP-dependent DNA ligase